MCGEGTPENVVRGQAGRAGQLRVEWDLPGHVHGIGVPEMIAADEQLWKNSAVFALTS
jgi:hypothetical protein